MPLHFTITLGQLDAPAECLSRSMSIHQISPLLRYISLGSQGLAQVPHRLDPGVAIRNCISRYVSHSVEISANMNMLVIIEVACGIDVTFCQNVVFLV